ncbi:MAG: lysylphosphatidylglycerol synthase transmembrane domain-containing protein [Chloroflexota bacterium]|nr:flippase-like domain-containing protein [Dehalococcoidia bacterium]MDW8045780.1 lysylphosphatidylglycerol synthase transmembrane domain-containing protein [Chloroflexota bacterium]
MAARVRVHVVRVLLGVGATGAFVWLILRDVHIGEVGRALASANLAFLPEIAAVYVVRFWLRALRWRVLVAHIKPVSVRDALPRVVLSQGANLVLPFQLGYGVMIQISARKFGMSRLHLLGAEAVERLMDGVTFAVFLGVTMAFLPIGAAFRGLTVFMLVGTALGVLLASEAARPASALSPARNARLRRWGGARLAEGLGAVRRPRQLAGVSALSAAIWLTEAVLFWLTARAFGLHAEPLVFVFLVAAANVGAAIPIAQSGVGFLLLAQQALIAVRQDPELATAYAIGLQGVLSLPFLVLGPLAAWQMRLSLAELLPWERPSSSPESQPEAAPQAPGVR